MKYETFDTAYKQALLGAKKELINKPQYQDVEVNVVAGLRNSKDYNIHCFSTIEECEQAILDLDEFTHNARQFVTGTSVRNHKFNAYFEVNDIQVIAFCTQIK